MSNTIVFPSGLTSREVQVPSLLVKWKLRCGFSGRSLNVEYFALSFPEESTPEITAATPGFEPTKNNKINTANLRSNEVLVIVFIFYCLRTRKLLKNTPLQTP